ncbi:MAG: FadD3 family acyl-CoA ligase [Microbacterium sp.]
MTAQEMGPSELAVLLRDAAARHADRVAIIDGDRRFTYRELADQARRFGAALVAHGIRPGDRVAIWAFNSAEWIIALLGSHQALATVLPVNTRFKGGEAADILHRGRARVLVTVTDFLGNDYVGMLRDAGRPLPHLETIVIAVGPARDGTDTWEAFLQSGREEDLAELDHRAAQSRSDTPADLLYTSGTTGAPKGVICTHAQTIAVARDWALMTGLSAGDRYLMINPFFHMFGMKAGILASVSQGATMIPLAVFDADRAMELVGEHGVTVLPGPPTLYQTILDHPALGSRDLSTLRVGVVGAADIPTDLVRRMYAELPFSLIVSGYGLTEAGTASSTAPTDSAETIAKTVGRARPGFEIRIVDKTGADAEPGEIGEILLRGPSVMSGYADDPAATASALKDGWLHTGDLGRLHDDGLLSIAGRTKDMYIVGGFNAYPAEIESILMRHESVRQAAVIGVPDDRLGEVGAAYVVLRAPVEADVLLAWCRDQMANYKVPRRLTFVDALPLNASGKVDKRVVRTWPEEPPR